MEEQNHIDKALAFLESLEKLGTQLKAAEENQKNLIARMLELKKSGEQIAKNTLTSLPRAKDCRTSSTNGVQSTWNEWKW